MGEGKSERGQRYSKHFRKRTERFRRCVAALSQISFVLLPPWGSLHKNSGISAKVIFIRLRKSRWKIFNSNPRDRHQCSEGDNAQHSPPEGTGSLRTTCSCTPFMLMTSYWAIWCGSRTHRTPPPRGAEATIKRLFPTLDPTDRNSLLAICKWFAHAAEACEAMNNRTEDMQCSRVMTEARRPTRSRAYNEGSSGMARATHRSPASQRQPVCAQLDSDFDQSTRLCWLHFLAPWREDENPSTMCWLTERAADAPPPAYLLTCVSIPCICRSWSCHARQMSKLTTRSSRALLRANSPSHTWSCCWTKITASRRWK